MRERAVQRYETVYLPRDGDELLKVLSDPGVAGYRIWQDYRVAVEIHGGSWTGGDVDTLRRWLLRAGVDADLPMDVEVLYKESGAGSRKSGGRQRRTPKIFVGSTPGCAMNPVGLHKGGTLFLCLNGPSFDEPTRAMLEHRPGVTTFCVNNGGHGFRPDYWACVDASSRFMESIWTDGTITKFVPAGFFKRSIFKDGSGPTVGECEKVWAFRRNDHFRAERFLTDPTFNWGNSKARGGGRSVMLVALGIAYRMGYRRVVLVGCDWEMTQEKWYWFPQGRTRRAIDNNMRTFRKLEGYFRELRPFFAAAGFRIVNATPGSKLREFPRVDLATEVARASARNIGASTARMYDVG